MGVFKNTGVYTFPVSTWGASRTDGQCRAVCGPGFEHTHTYLGISGKGARMRARGGLFAGGAWAWRAARVLSWLRVCGTLRPHTPGHLCADGSNRLELGPHAHAKNDGRNGAGTRGEPTPGWLTTLGAPAIRPRALSPRRNPCALCQRLYPAITQPHVAPSCSTC